LGLKGRTLTLPRIPAVLYQLKLILSQPVTVFFSLVSLAPHQTTSVPIVALQLKLFLGRVTPFGATNKPVSFPGRQGRRFKEILNTSSLRLALIGFSVVEIPLRIYPHTSRFEEKNPFYLQYSCLIQLKLRKSHSIIGKLVSDCGTKGKKCIFSFVLISPILWATWNLYSL